MINETQSIVCCLVSFSYIVLGGSFLHSKEQSEVIVSRITVHYTRIYRSLFLPPNWIPYSMSSNIPDCFLSVLGYLNSDQLYEVIRSTQDCPQLLKLSRLIQITCICIICHFVQSVLFHHSLPLNDADWSSDGTTGRNHRLLILLTLPVLHSQFH